MARMGFDIRQVIGSLQNHQQNEVTVAYSMLLHRRAPDPASQNEQNADAQVRIKHSKCELKTAILYPSLILCWMQESMDVHVQTSYTQPASSVQDNWALGFKVTSLTKIQQLLLQNLQSSNIVSLFIAVSGVTTANDGWCSKGSPQLECEMEENRSLQYEMPVVTSTTKLLSTCLTRRHQIRNSGDHLHHHLIKYYTVHSSYGYFW